MALEKNKVATLLDRYYQDHKQVEKMLNALSREEALEESSHFERLDTMSHEQAKELYDLVENGTRTAALKLGKAIKGHQWHSEILLQSAFIKNALEKKYGYAGDKDLMLMICEHADHGTSNYSILKNRVYLSLPAAQAVRDRIYSLHKLLTSLDEGCKVLNLACGPAIEVGRCLTDRPNDQIEVDLLDHDIHTVRHVRSQIRDHRASVYLGNAFEIIRGNYRVATPRKAFDAFCKPEQDFKGMRKYMSPIKYEFKEIPKDTYDLVYSAGLFDYIRKDRTDDLKGASGLTLRLFDCLKPGGQLLIGNYLSHSPNNPHKKHHRMMMEQYSDWHLLYREIDDIKAFASAIDPSRYEMRILDESLHDMGDSGKGVIGFLMLTKV